MSKEEVLDIIQEMITSLKAVMIEDPQYADELQINLEALTTAVELIEQKQGYLQ